MIDLDMPTAAGMGVILLAFLGPYFYAFFIDKWAKDTPDPRRRTF